MLGTGNRGGEDVTYIVNMWGTALKEQNDKYNPLNDIEI